MRYKHFVFIVGIGLLAYFLYWHYTLGLTRYFDVDEFAYLHWARQVSAGFVPYRDFFSYIPPGFFWFLAPLFRIGLTGIAPVLAARAVMFVVFVTLCSLLILLFYRIRKTWFGVVAAVTLAFIPMPFDKFIEIRPESLGTAFLLAGLLFQVIAIDSQKKSHAWLSGVAYALGLLITPKIAPNVALSGLLLHVSSRGRKSRLGPLFTQWVIGLSLPLFVFLLWVLVFGDIQVAIYSLVKLPFEVNNISRWFIMQPDLFFYPNAIFYGRDGYTFGLYINHIVWIIGLGFGVYRLLTPFLAQEKQYIQKEFLISGNLFIQVVMYVLFIPLKHTQYLIPIVVFVAFYVGDISGALWSVWRRRPMASFFSACILLIAGVVSTRAFLEVNGPKITSTHEKTLTAMVELYKTIPQTEYILDLDGRTLYYPNPYYVCCLPFGQHEPFLSRPLPSLIDALEKTQTRYVYEGELKRIQTLSPVNQTYIYRNYTPSGIANLWVRK